MVYVVLRISSSSEDALKEFLPRLDIKLDVHVISDIQEQSNQQGLGDQAEPEKDLVFSGNLKNDKDPFIAVNSEEESGEDPSILAIWEIEATLFRPRIRFPNPAVTFTASASLTPAKDPDKGTYNDEYLPSLVPAPTNIFERLKMIPALEDRAPYLAASRIESVLPSPQLDSETLHIRHQPTKRFPITPAVSARIRCSQVNTTSQRPTTIASLDFEVTPFATFDVLLNSAQVSLVTDGQIEPLHPLPLPITCRSRDIITFLYKVLPSTKQPDTRLTLSSGPPANVIGLLDITLETVLQISAKCRPTITMRWRSNVDFLSPLEPRLGPSSTQTLQRLSRPNSLPFPSNNTTIPSTTSTISRPPSPQKDPRPSSLVPPITTSTTTPSFSGHGLTVSFTVPLTTPLGSIFPLTILLTNHSSRPLKLAIIPIPRRATTSSTLRKHAPKPSTSSSVDRHHARNSGAEPVAVAPAVMDENIVYALQKAANTSSMGTELVPLSPDVRVGPLGVGSCQEVQVKMLGLKVGVLRLEAVRVVDLAKEQEAATIGGGGGGLGSAAVVDVKGEWLPEIVVVEGDDGQQEEGQEGGKKV